MVANPDSPIKFKFAMIFGSFGSSVPSQNELYKSIPQDFMSFHAWGTGDDLVPCEYSKKLAGLFPSPVIFEHFGGHVVPSSGQAKTAYKDFLQKFLTDFQNY